MANCVWVLLKNVRNREKYNANVPIQTAFSQLNKFASWQRIIMQQIVKWFNASRKCCKAESKMNSEMLQDGSIVQTTM